MLIRKIYQTKKGQKLISLPSKTKLENGDFVQIVKVESLVKKECEVDGNE